MYNSYTFCDLGAFILVSALVDAELQNIFRWELLVLSVYLDAVKGYMYKPRGGR